MATNLSSLSFNVNATNTWQASVNQTGLSSPLSNNNNYSKKLSLGNGVTNTTSLGADELYVSLVTAAASGSVTITISNITDACGQTGIAFARLKYWRFQLLSLSDDSVNGTACSSVIIGNAASHPFGFTFGGATNTFQIYNGDIWEYATVSATGIAVTSGSNDQIKFANQDSSHAMAMLVILCGGST
jgi:hypothetical protein